MAKKDLIIVESPTKSRTLARFLGDKYQLAATMGHLRDLPKSKLGVDVKKNFQPQYVLVQAKKETIGQLKEAAQKAKQVFLATDPDREGEAIAWHVAQILREIPNSLLRITFHEITESAIKEALAHPGKINRQLVNAQQARRVLDRLVGYKLSPLLWRKIRLGLSAGRVQSVALRLIVEREQEIGKFRPEEYWEVWAELKGKLKEAFLAKLIKIGQKKVTIKNKTAAQKITGELKKAVWQVEKIERRETKRLPSPPFTTSTLQQRAAQKLYFSSQRTMRLAQSLYEKGLITYHRTDSVTLASQAVAQIRQYINSSYGKENLPGQARVYKTRSKVAQEAHEAIRPTKFDTPGVSRNTPGVSGDEKRLYQLIFNRAVASQMKPAIYDRTKIFVLANDKYQFLAEAKIIKFPGWLKIYGGDTPGVSRDTPGVSKGEKLKLLKLDPRQKFTQPPPRYNDASLVKALEQRGIGRPSTYAPIITTIQRRQYVEKKDRAFWPTHLGVTVNNFLVKHFPAVFDYDFTAQMEDELDKIARGERRWQPVIKEFYTPFAEKLTKVIKEADRVKVPVEKTGRKCPQCSQGELVIRTGRFGKFLACSRFPDCRYTEPYVEKLEGVKCPKCGGQVVIKKTKKGRQFYGCLNYPKCKWASWRKPK